MSFEERMRPKGGNGGTTKDMTLTRTRAETQHPSVPPSRSVPSPEPKVYRSYYSMDPLAGNHLRRTAINEHTHPVPYRPSHSRASPDVLATSLQLNSFSHARGLHLDPVIGAHKRQLPEASYKLGASSPVGLHLDPLHGNHGRHFDRNAVDFRPGHNVVTGLITESFGREQVRADTNTPRRQAPVWSPSKGLATFGESERGDKGRHVDPMHSHHRRSCINSNTPLLPVSAMSPRGSAFRLAKDPAQARSTSVDLATESKKTGLHVDPMHSHHRKYDSYYWRSRVPLFGNTT